VIRGYSAEQMRAAEAPHLAAGEPLMHRAAAGLADEIRQSLVEGRGRVLLLVGTGNNGADTLYAGAELAQWGADVAILTTGPRAHEEAMAAALAAGAHRESADTAAELAARADVVVDGILGTGTSRNPALRGDKAGLLLPPASGLAGRVHVIDIGLGPDLDALEPSVTVPG
jgi:NAD(P)H-hydrate epimerase